NQAGLTVSLGAAGGAADGFGKFDWQLDFGSAQSARLNTSTTATVTATFSGTITDADLKVTVNGGQGFGPQAGVIDLKPLTGATGFGGGNVSTTVVPDPSALVSGCTGVLICLGYGWRRRRRAAA